jgi:glutamate-1-semialdehyde 2,1-aminomutase
MWGVYFREGPVRNFSDALKVDRELFAGYYRECLEGGVFFAPSPFEAGFVSTAHGDHEVERTFEVVRHALAKVTGAG